MENKPFHYWMIHKRVFRRLWNKSSWKTRDIVTNGATWTDEYVDFMRSLKSETDALFNDPDHYYNERTTFVEQPQAEPRY